MQPSRQARVEKTKRIRLQLVRLPVAGDTSIGSVGWGRDAVLVRLQVEAHDHDMRVRRLELLPR